jgi:hypothetical protein
VDPLSRLKSHPRLKVIYRQIDAGCGPRAFESSLIELKSPFPRNGIYPSLEKATNFDLGNYGEASDSPGLLIYICAAIRSGLASSMNKRIVKSYQDISIAEVTQCDSDNIANCAYLVRVDTNTRHCTSLPI